MDSLIRLNWGQNLAVNLFCAMCKGNSGARDHSRVWRRGIQREPSLRIPSPGPTTYTRSGGIYMSGNMYVSTEVPGNRGYSRRSPNAETGGSWCQRGDARGDGQWSRAASHARCQRRSGATQGGASPDGAEDRGREWVGAGGPPGGAEVPEVAEAWAEAAEADVLELSEAKL